MTTETDDLNYYELELPKIIAGVRRGEKWEFDDKDGWYAPPDQSIAFLKVIIGIGGSGHRVRLAPVPVVKPWDCPDDVPGPVCWLRNNQGFMGMVIGLCEQGPIVVAPIADERNGRHVGPYRWENLCGWQYSTDRINWKPCVKPEGGK